MEAALTPGTAATGPSRRILDPLSRMSEVLFGLIMALTFTCTLDAASGGREEVHTLMIGAITCNIAWGLVDAVMFLIASITERGRDLVTMREVRAAKNPMRGRRTVADAVSPMMSALLTDDDFERVRRQLVNVRQIPPRPWLERDDWLGAAGVFLLVFVSTLPIVVPFFFLRDVRFAMQISNGVAISLLFGAGFALARYGGYRPWLTGFGMVALGVALVELTIALGG